MDFVELEETALPRVSYSLERVRASLPGGKESAAVQEIWVESVGWEDPLEKKMATHSSTLP